MKRAEGETRFYMGDVFPSNKEDLKFHYQGRFRTSDHRMNDSLASERERGPQNPRTKALNQVDADDIDIEVESSKEEEPMTAIDIEEILEGFNDRTFTKYREAEDI